MTATTDRPIGELLRSWRQQRRISQLDLALDAEVSARHISFLETGRAQPSRQMVLHLAEYLDVPLRERNALLIAAGYAPIYAGRSLDDPEMEVVRTAVLRVLTGHEPYPAIAIDRYWNLMHANRAASMFLSSIPPHLLEPPTNVLRLSLHPQGLAPRILNLNQWRGHVLRRLRKQIEQTPDAALEALHAELTEFGTPGEDAGVRQDSTRQAVDDLVIPMRLTSELGELSFFTTTTIFGHANDVTVSELAIESFFPADAATGEALRASFQP